MKCESQSSKRSSRLVNKLVAIAYTLCSQRNKLLKRISKTYKNCTMILKDSLIHCALHNLRQRKKIRALKVASTQHRKRNKICLKKQKKLKRIMNIDKSSFKRKITVKSKNFKKSYRIQQSARRTHAKKQQNYCVNRKR